MSKAARRAHQAQSRHAASHPVALAGAARARTSFDLLWASTEERLTATLRAMRGPASRERIRIPIGQVHRHVAELKSHGHAWAPATYVPGTMVGGVVMRQFLDDLDVNPATIPVEVEQMAGHLGATMAVLAGWDRAPLVAVFDDALANALIGTPMSGEIPRELLQRLPAWTVYIATPWLHERSGVFVAFDAGAVFRDGESLGDSQVDDDFVLLFAIEDPATSLMAYFRCSEPTITASIDAQQADVGVTGALLEQMWGFEAAEASSQDLFARPYRDVLEEVMALVLYLCSEEPDIRPVDGPTGAAPRGRPTGQPTTVEVGYRVGAALRAITTESSSAGESRPDGHARPTPHIRAAHWHTYWYGPRHDAAARTARLRWVAPVLVNAEIDRPVPTARRVKSPS